MKNKKTVIFFDRLELTDLHGGISNSLIDVANVIHISYSSKEAKDLREKYGIESTLVFKDELAKLLPTHLTNVDLIKEIDQSLIEFTNKRFCLNGAIQSDRGLSLLSYEEALILAQVYYLFWKELFSKYPRAILVHEPTSLLLNHLAFIVSKEAGGYYCSPVDLLAEDGFSFLFLFGDTGSPLELINHFDSLSPEHILANEDRISAFLSKFRKSGVILFSKVLTSKVPVFRTFFSAMKRGFKKIVSLSSLNRLLDNIEIWELKNNIAYSRLKNYFAYKYLLKYDKVDENDIFYYYPFHLEPEAVVLYWGDGIYKGQVKLIENIAGQLPPNTYLYVKDHPHYVGYRSIKDYLYLQKIPNIKLLNPAIPGRALIGKAKGVMTINGSVGLEAILMNKPVYIFGNAYYELSDRVFKVKSIKDLNEILACHEALEFHDDDKLKKFVLAYFNSCHPGVVDFFSHRIYKYPIDYDQNVKAVSKAFKKLIVKLT